jgi:hypothetical protein
MFQVSSRSSSRAQQLPLVLSLERGESSVVVGPAGSNAPTIKTEAATAVVELLMMGVRTSKTC